MIALTAVALSSALILLLVVFFNVWEKEEGFASGGMVFRQVTVTQDTTPVLRGSIHQMVLGVSVETMGKGTPLKAQRFVFQLVGSAASNQKNIENARLWYTGNDPEFSPQEMIGSSILKLSSDPLVFLASQELLQGKNHFWLTFDVKADATAPGAWVDASCIEVFVGGVKRMPAKGSPDGRRWIQNNVPYYSMGNYSLNKLASWNSRRDGSGVRPRQLNETRNSYFIQSGHRMISSTGGNFQTLVVERGGELKITAPLRLNALQVAFGGKVQVDSLESEGFQFDEFSMDAGGVYFHNHPGGLPAFNCRFSPGSNQVFFNYSKGTFNRPIVFGSVLFDAQNAPETTVRPENMVVQGDLEFRKTGTNGFHFSQGEGRIDGNLTVSGGSLTIGKEGHLSMTVGGGLKILSGCFSGAGYKTGSVSSRLDVYGDVLLLGGQFDLAGSTSSELNLCGPSLTRWIQRESCRVRLGNVNVRSGHIVAWKGERVGPLSESAGWKIESGGELHCGTTVLEGEGAFLLDDLAVLCIGHPDGLYSLGRKGNIQTDTRHYHSGAIYRYDGAAHPQATGEFKTSPRNQSVRRLIVDKPTSVSVLHLSQDLIVEELCRVQSGDLRQNGFSLTIQNNRLTGSR